MGNPVAHSRSPFIHASFAEQTDRRIDYLAEWVAIDDFERWVADFFAQDGSGLNVTLPFKTRAFELADEASARAQSAGAANFLMKSPEGRVIADNTDGKGLVADMTAGAGWSLAGKRILVIGAGGAVKGVIPALLESSPQNILIVNRTAARAATLADGWRAQGAPVQGAGLEAAASGAWDVIINGTSTGLSGGMPTLPDALELASGCCCYDMAYGDEPTPFMQWARASGAADARDGLGMLVEQAAESFYLWLGLYPETRPVIELLRATPKSESSVRRG